MDLNNFRYQILESLKDAGLGLREFLLTPYGQLRLHPRQSYYSAFNSLVKRKLITKQLRGRTNLYSITRKGKSLLLQQTKLSKRKDGNLTVVIYDIPEQKRKQRAALRRYLKNKGYLLLQKSVFVSEHHPVVQIKDIIQELKLSGYVTLLSARIEKIY